MGEYKQLKITLLIKLICYDKALLVPICRRQQNKLITLYFDCSCNVPQTKIKYSFSKSAFPALFNKDKKVEIFSLSSCTISLFVYIHPSGLS